jgi:hypothetical protein
MRPLKESRPTSYAASSSTMKSVRLIALSVIVSICAALPVKSNGAHLVFSIQYGRYCLAT